ncbi:MAG: tRNA (adenosine(37)-N6)-threonylcarbamoyltransferase complex dimerization subunit type 1 TsaB [bacterium]
MITLVVEASTYAGSAALLDGSTLLGQCSVAMRGKEHEALMPAVATLLAESGRRPEEIERIVCGAGPGSFTSLRIAASIAKGIALASGATLIPVSSLALLVASHEPQTPGRYIATVDAMRGESYVQEFEVGPAGDVRAIGEIEVIPTSTVDQFADSAGAIALGPTRHAGALVVPHARAAAHITNQLDATAPADLAGWEPRYGRLAEAQVKWEAEHGRPLQPG